MMIVFSWVSITLLDLIADATAYGNWWLAGFFLLLELLVTALMILLVYQLYRMTYGGQNDQVVDSSSFNYGNESVYPDYSIHSSDDVPADSSPTHIVLDSPVIDPAFDSSYPSDHDQGSVTTSDPDSDSSPNFAPKRNLT
jgi:hypothetical protein